jgi:glutamate racemase
MSGKIGIIDWGIGGISVYQRLRSRFDNAAFVYFSDTGAVPYGRMKRPDLAARIDRVIDFLVGHDVTHVVIGCNAASTAIRDLRRTDVLIEGVIESAVDMAAKLGPRKLSVIGGRRTVTSGIYRKKFAARGIGIEQRVAQPLSALIESGDISSERLRAECRRILTPIKKSSHILLACTHYPAISGVIREFVANECVLLDPSAALAERIGHWEVGGKGVDEFYTTGDAEAMKTAALNAFGAKIAAVRKLDWSC